MYDKTYHFCLEYNITRKCIITGKREQKQRATRAVQQEHVLICLTRWATMFRFFSTCNIRTNETYSRCRVSSTLDTMNTIFLPYESETIVLRM